MDVRKIIRDEARRRGWSIAELTRRVGCGQMTIYNYLAGRTEMRADLLERVLRVLDIKLTAEER